MRSKVESVVESEGGGAAPGLRFPGFTEAWRAKELGKEGSFLSSLTGKKGADFGVGNAKFVPYMNVFSNAFVDDTDLGLVHVELDESQTQIREGDVLFTISSETPDEAGMSSVVLSDIPNCYVNSFCTVFRFDEGKSPNPIFVGYLLRQPSTRAYFSAKAQGSTRFNLSKDAFRGLSIGIPCEDEQRKVADCLLSLDSSIAAETRKFDALKAHKQGLMQQLFPAEGERQPDLRFPEFDGDWDTVALGDVSAVVRGGSPRPIDSYITHAADGLNWLRIGDVDKAAKYIERTEQKVIEVALGKTRQVRPGDLILSNSMSFGRPYISNITCCIHDGWLAITQISKQITSDFLYYALGSSACQTYFLNAAAGSGVKNLNSDIIKQLSIAVPALEEQKKISDCLSEIDDVIAIQSRKIALFQQHKAGLMQGLFPMMEALAP
ncbi:restriction endonuclease subunit S [Pseudoxanthomonas sp.]|jgi:Restriction endonuclease S subunits|uniref:restriction endonuclease subunit S n=1 Tax=Pseudoxanthomonas sp. TaxID=1871049 RepID=UPI002FE3EA18